MQVRRALDRVYDPCSLALNNPLSIVDMGLVREWHQDDGTMTVTICVTGPGCMMAPKIIDAAREELERLDFVNSVDIRLDPSVLWTEDMMTDRGRRLQELRHKRAHTVSEVRPQQWRTQAIPPGERS